MVRWCTPSCHLVGCRWSVTWRPRAGSDICLNRRGRRGCWRKFKRELIDIGRGKSNLVNVVFNEIGFRHYCAYGEGAFSPSSSSGFSLFGQRKVIKNSSGTNFRVSPKGEAQDVLHKIKPTRMPPNPCASRQMRRAQNSLHYVSLKQAAYFSRLWLRCSGRHDGINASQSSGTRLGVWPRDFHANEQHSKTGIRAAACLSRPTGGDKTGRIAGLSTLSAA